MVAGKKNRPVRHIQYGQQHNVLLKAIEITEKLSEITGSKRKVQELQEQARLLRMAYIPDQVKQVMDDPKGKVHHRLFRRERQRSHVYLPSFHIEGAALKNRVVAP